MKRRQFEKVAKPGDLVFLLTDDPSDSLSHRVIRSGIYSRSTNKEYGEVRSFGIHVPPFGHDQLHGWDFNTTGGSFSYDEVLHAKVVLTKSEISELAGTYLDDLAAADYNEKFR